MYYDKKEYLTAKDIAKTLGVLESSISRWLNKNDKRYIPSFPKPIQKIGKYNLWLYDDFIKYQNNKLKEDKNLFNAKDIAKYLNISVPYVYFMINKDHKLYNSKFPQPIFKNKQWKWNKNEIINFYNNSNFYNLDKISVTELAKLISIDRTTINSWGNKNRINYRPDFPKPISVKKYKTYWLRSEIEYYFKKYFDIDLNNKVNQGKRLYIKDVAKIFYVSFRTIYSWINKDNSNYVPDFPKPIRLSSKIFIWYEKSIFDYIESKKRILN